MSVKFSFATDSEDYLDFDNGTISVEEDGSGARSITLSKRAAIQMATKLLIWADR